MQRNHWVLRISLGLLLVMGIGCSDSVEDEGQDVDDGSDAIGGDVDMGPDVQVDLPDAVEDLVAEVEEEADLVPDMVEDQPEEEVIEPPVCPPGESLELEQPAHDDCLPLGVTNAIDIINANVRAHLTQLAASMAFLDDSSLIVKFEEMFDVNQECPDEEPDCARGIDFSSFETEAGDLADNLAEDIFSAENVDTSDGCSVVFRVSPELLCDRDPEFPDAFCVWDQVPLRLVAWAAGTDQIYLEMFVGTQSDVANPADFRVFPEEAGAIVDLEAIQQTMEIISSNEQEPWDVPELMEGRIEALLLKEGTGHFSAGLSIRSAIDFQYTIEDEGTGPDHEISFQMDPMCPILEAEINSSMEGLWVRSDVRPAEFHGPIEMFYECDPEYETCDDPQGDLGILVSGAGMEVTLDMSTESIFVDQITLGHGASMATFEADPLVTVNLNEDYGREVSVNLHMDENDWSIEVSPRLDLEVALDFQALVGQLSDLPDWPLDEVMSILLDGASPPSLLVLDTSGETDPEFAIKVTAGLLSLVSAYLESTLTVGTGSCLLPAPDPVEPTEEELHPFEELISGVCP